MNIDNFEKLTSWPQKLLWLLKGLLKLQGLALFLSILFTFYGSSKPEEAFFPIFYATLVFTNLSSLSVHVFYYLIFRLQRDRIVKMTPRGFLRHFAVVYLGFFVGYELSRVCCNFLFPTTFKLPLFSMQNVIFHLFNLVVVFFIILGVGGFSSLKNRLQRKDRELEELQNLQLKTQLAVLQAKLNPHFLFNSLNAILDLVYKSPQQVETMVLNLSHIYRQVLSNSEREWSTLAEEMELLEKYLQVEQIRLGERLTYHLSCPVGVREWPIPPLLLQPLVENAVIHGIAPKIAGGEIFITIQEEANHLVIGIVDSGAGIGQSHVSSGFGLQSVRERMRILYGNDCLFRMTETPGGGTTVQLELPRP